MAKREMPRPFYDDEQTVGRKSVYAWRPTQRWPATYQLTHRPEHADVQQFHGIVFRAESDAAIHDVTYLDPAIFPQPVIFESWEAALAWVKEPVE